MLCPAASAPRRRSDRQGRCRDDPALFEIPRRPPLRVLQKGTLDLAHIPDRALRTSESQRTPYQAQRNHREPPFAGARSRPEVRRARARKERTAWEDTRIAQPYPPGIVSRGRRRAVATLKRPLRGPARRLPHIPRRGPLQVSVPPEPAPSPLRCFRNALHTPPPRLGKSPRFRPSRSAVPTRSPAPTWRGPALSAPNGRAPKPDGATSGQPRAPRARERFRGPFQPGHPLQKRGSTGRRESPNTPLCGSQPAADSENLLRKRLWVARLAYGNGMAGSS